MWESAERSIRWSRRHLQSTLVACQTQVRAGKRGVYRSGRKQRRGKSGNIWDPLLLRFPLIPCGRAQPRNQARSLIIEYRLDTCTMPHLRNEHGRRASSTGGTHFERAGSRVTCENCKTVDPNRHSTIQTHAVTRNIAIPSTVHVRTAYVAKARQVTCLLRSRKTSRRVFLR